MNGLESYSERVLDSGTLRGRIGYAPGSWLVYATGGFAWTYNQLTLTPNWPAARPIPRVAIGLGGGSSGVEFAVAPNWTASVVPGSEIC